MGITNKYLPTSDHLNRPSHLRPNSTHSAQPDPNQYQLQPKSQPNINMDATTQNKRTSTDARRPSGERFSKISAMKRDPANDRQTARRASFEEQSIPKGAGFLGDMWNKYTRGSN